MKRTLAIALALFPAVLAAEPPALTGAEWQIYELAGSETLPVTPTLAFSDEGRFSGMGGCNRMMGSFTQDDTALRFGQVAATMMICPEPQMNLERAVHDALSRVTAHRFDEDTLVLLDGDTVLLRARRP